ncbi:hypothetical protein GJ744_012452 [Endocarpon pusillum]|uniref:Heterokaryon incompatibility domain-containing protein n=1 Tax=Endocarpon pusillum TaxID=364733 RepID=A0A8H7E1G7_9EURO|nr:hypothetical protein GJ744_012452 [Endocarpon pusillum]
MSMIITTTTSRLPASGARDHSYTSGFGESVTRDHSYIPLPHARAFRLLEFPKVLLPTTELRCKLRTVDFDAPDRPPYTALSYSWSNSSTTELPPDSDLDPLLTNVIVCDDGLLRVTENAHAAISEMRWRGSAGLYWIDGVCIDQGNPAEKSEQVAFMGEIYKEADRVIVWLGPDEEDDRKAFEVIEDLRGGHATNIRRLIYAYMQKNRFQDPDQYFQLSLAAAVIPIYSSLLAFFARSWFQRLWIIQEAVLAKSLWFICGGLHFDWEKLHRATELQGTLSIMQQIAPGETTTRGLFGLSLVRKIFELRTTDVAARSLSSAANQEQRLGATLAYLMPAFQNANTTDSRDRIYGPLALACQLTGFANTLLVPDYTQTVEHVFVTAAEYLLIQAPSLEILSLVDAADASRLPALPSWVPDFRTRSRFKSIALYSPGNATRGWPYRQPHLKRYAGRACSVLQGLWHATLSEVTVGVVELLQRGEIVSLLLFTQLSKSVIFHGESSTRVMLEILLAGRGLISGPNQPEGSIFLARGFESWLTLKVAHSWYKGFLAEHVVAELLKREERSAPNGRLCNVSEDSLTLMRILDEANKTHDLVINATDRPDQPSRVVDDLFLGDWLSACAAQSCLDPCIAGRSMFLTATSEIGLTSDHARAGDQIWFFSGAKTPFVLRPLENGHYVLIGEAYLKGYMDGQICQMHDVKRLRPVTLE